MCGIAGWIDWENNLEKERAVLDAMVATLKDRGPDGAGTYVKQGVALGHRRLNVIDLVTGGQPMMKERGGHEYVITYNGELYNAPELRRDLEARGYRFTTTSDTEVLLSAYMEYGPACVEKFNGIFAFAIWNAAEESLFMARDRIGVKPLFYAERGRGLIFGSELKTVLANPLVQPELDKEGLAEVFMIGPARTPGNGVFRGVYELKPGHSMFYNRNGKRIVQYWAFQSKPHEDDFEKTVQTVRDLLIDTVERQLISDVPMCTFLSGGLDSSALTALAAAYYERNGLGRLNTYSVDYQDNDKYFQESTFQPNTDAPWVQRVSEHFNTNHTIVVLDNAELASSLPRTAAIRDLPGMADIDASLYLFARQVKQGATVALSGESADEVFGGYPWFYREAMIGATTFPWSLNTEIRLDWLKPEIKAQLDLPGYVADRYSQALADVPRLPGETGESARMREIFYLSLTRWMPTLLDRNDRMSMAAGLEVRVPYCDHRLMEYVWNVPWEMKNYQQREKGLLRHALTGVLPDDVLWRKKSPYPKTHNPQYLNTVRNWALEILADPSSPLQPVIDVQAIKAIAQTDLSASNIPWFGQLMGGAQLFAYLVQADAWMRKYRVKLV